MIRRQISPPSEAEWRTLKYNRTDRGFLTTMGVDLSTFDFLLVLFDREKPMRKRLVGGRPNLLDSESHLAFVLHFLSSRAEQNVIGRLFGLTPASSSNYIWRGIRILLKALRKEHQARIQYPNSEEIHQLSMMLTVHEPCVQNVFGFLDGLNCPILNPEDQIQQNAYYNGWKSVCFVSAVILYAIDGSILWSSFNCPGSWHDAKIAQQLYELLIHSTPVNYAVIADTAFPRNQDCKNRTIPLFLQSITESQQSSIITSIRQATEWGMR